jgi:hypothetical protein
MSQRAWIQKQDSKRESVSITEPLLQGIQTVDDAITVCSKAAKQQQQTLGDSDEADDNVLVVLCGEDSIISVSSSRSPGSSSRSPGSSSSSGSPKSEILSGFPEEE